MRRVLLVLAMALVPVIGFAVPASANTDPCFPGMSSCYTVIDTANPAAQHEIIGFYCISTTNADIGEIKVYNNASDHQQHTYVVQIRREEPVNEEMWSITVSIGYHAWSDIYNIPFSSVPRQVMPYIYVRSGLGVEQRISPWHMGGPYPPWATVNQELHNYGYANCV